MERIEVKECQKYLLQLAKTFHKICVRNSIPYYMIGGTQLGAIRHKGFIPWDDDIDIVMPRPDYERFCNTFKSDAGYDIFSPIAGNCYLGYARVCDLKRTWVHSMPWCNQSPTGIWIDIFPIDGIDTNRDKNADFQYLSNLEKRRYKARMPKDNLKRPMPFKRQLRTIIKKILFCWTDIKTVVSEYDNFIKGIEYDSSDYCGNRAILTYYKKEEYIRSLFDSYTAVEFEGNCFKAIASYDRYLRTIYGNYMQLPPEDKRVRHPQEMYWV